MIRLFSFFTKIRVSPHKPGSPFFVGLGSSLVFGAELNTQSCEPVCREPVRSKHRRPRDLKSPKSNVCASERHHRAIERTLDSSDWKFQSVLQDSRKVFVFCLRSAKLKGPSQVPFSVASFGFQNTCKQASRLHQGRFW